MEKSSNKLVDLSVTFAVEILNLVKYLKMGQQADFLLFRLIPISHFDENVSLTNFYCVQKMIIQLAGV